MSHSNLSDQIVIVSGLPRSGTSMMMRMLEAGGVPIVTDDIRQADVNNPNGYYEFEPVKKLKEDTSWVRDAKGKAVKAVYVHLRDLPPGFEYRVVFMTRDADEIVASQDVMLERSAKPQTGLAPDAVKKVFQRQLDDVRRWLDTQPNFAVLEIDYNEIIQDPTVSLERLNEFLGGTLNVDAMASIVDPKLYRNRSDGAA